MTEEKKFYLTKEGLAKIEKEYEDLKALKHAKTSGEAPKILHSEDLSQEYLSFQEDISFLDSKIGELEYVLKNTELIKNHSGKRNQVVEIGSTVFVDADGKTNEFTLVGSLEADPDLGKISNESPVGKALLGHKIGDKVELPSGKIVYKIKKIEHGKV